jgi:hypothetical protein
VADGHVELMEAIVLTLIRKHKCVREMLQFLAPSCRISALGARSSADPACTSFARLHFFLLHSDIFSHASKWHYDDAPTEWQTPVVRAMPQT